MKKIIFLSIFLVTSCGVPDWTLRSLPDEQPHVVEALPASAEVEPGTVFTLHFSTAIEPTSLTNKAVLLLEGEVETDGMKDLVDDIDEGKIQSVSSRIELSEDCLEVIVFPLSLLQGGKSYSLLVTSDLMAPGFLSFNQTPGSSATPFKKIFYVKPDQSVVTNSQGVVSEPEENISPVSETVPIPVEEPRIPLLLINEVYYDAPGSDTDGVLFVELKGEPGEEMIGAEIIFVNGDDGKITASFLIPDYSVIPENGLFVAADLSTGSSTST
ncbi:MAG: hypothetical protein Q7S00_01925, partial [bacterium]|nr:hypothetical protein [bacterium]